MAQSPQKSNEVRTDGSAWILGRDRLRRAMAADELSQETETVGGVDAEEEDGENEKEFPSVAGGYFCGEEEGKRRVEAQEGYVRYPEAADEEGEDETEGEKEDEG